MEKINILLFNLINSLASTHTFLNEIMVFIAKYVVFAIPVYLIYLLLKKRFEEFFMITLSISLALLAGYITKNVFYHPRPFAMGIGINLVKDDFTSSFPSNHTTSMFAFVTALLLEKNYKVGLLSILLGLLVGISRIYIGVHFPFDIIGGIVYGVVVALLTFSMFKEFPKELFLKFLKRI